ncbi:MAG: dTDP-4-dehydrorhamnose 3,5-epimerase family protein [Pseudomonadota bacterium]
MNIGTPPQDLLDVTLNAATKDKVTTDTTGQPNIGLPEGASLTPANVITDARGSLFEVARASTLPDQPMVQVYGVTLRPGVVKGWALHKTHEDRYFILTGDMEVVLFDVRPDSATQGQLFRIMLSDKHRALLTIPRYVWHADHNVGHQDVLLINMPTAEYNYEDPDKYRLPLDTDLIPFDFGDARGW